MEEAVLKSSLETAITNNDDILIVGLVNKFETLYPIEMNTIITALIEYATQHKSTSKKDQSLIALLKYKGYAKQHESTEKISQHNNFNFPDIHTSDKEFKTDNPLIFQNLKTALKLGAADQLPNEISSLNADQITIITEFCEAIINQKTDSDQNDQQLIKNLKQIFKCKEINYDVESKQFILTFVFKTQQLTYPLFCNKLIKIIKGE